MITKKRKLLFAAIAAAVILTLAGSLVAFAAPAGADNAPERTISVNGTAQVTLKPDVAYVTFGTLTNDQSAAAARGANDTLMGKVMTAVKAQGVDTDKDVKTVNYSIYPRYDNNGTTITGYEVSNSIQVKVRNLDKLGAIMDAAVSAGANLSNGLYFDVEDSDAAYNQALEKAIENARQRAETLAKSAGGAVGAVVNASQSGGYYPPTPYYYGRSAMDIAAGEVPVSAGTLNVSAYVNITFELK
jgi:uncharacterized protein YggE